MTSNHFKDKSAYDHVAEVQAQGIISSVEVHGTEVPGHISAAADAARETSIALLFIWCLLIPFHLALMPTIQFLGIFSVGWIVWKCGRSAILGWSRLERLHRVLEQERWEIQHHRQQEREEMRVLYSAKGFEGKLLEEVVDVLMADDNRLLRIMIEEEMRLSLETHEHPLKQAVGAFLGSLVAGVICLASLTLSSNGILISTFIIIAVAAAMTAQFAQNRWIPSIVWNLGLAAVSFGCVFFLLQYLFTGG